MKIVLLLTVLTVYTAFAVPVENVAREEDIDLALSQVRDLPHYLIEYYLFTRSNPTTAARIFMNDDESIRSSPFNPNNPTIIIAHGFLGSHNSGVNPAIRDAYLQKSDVNVISLNWQRLGSDDEDSAMQATPGLGRVLGQFLNYLSQVSGARFDNMHMIGFSLGAHLVANAGKELYGQIARITGLDPAGSFWSLHPLRLRPSDAQYVEGIHTDEEFGINSPVGDVDFFPNGGNNQPGCVTSICNHSRSWQLFAATITYDHLEGRRCTTTAQMLSNLCFGDRLNMGNEQLRKDGSGIYRVNTGWRYPY